MNRKNQNDVSVRLVAYKANATVELHYDTDAQEISPHTRVSSVSVLQIDVDENCLQHDRLEPAAWSSTARALAKRAGTH